MERFRENGQSDRRQVRRVSKKAPFGFTFDISIDQRRTLMPDRTYWDTFKAESENVLNRIRALVHEGNVRRVIVKQSGRTVAEFPLTAGVVGALVAPVLAAIGALVALLQDCTIEVERERQDASRDEGGPPTAARA
jgi:hypothetical protein